MAILKIFKLQLLPNGKSDWGKTWWVALGRHGDSELLKPFVMISMMAARAAILKIFNCLLTWSFTPGHLCHGLLTMVRPSSICPSVSFHIFDISIISMMITMVAFLKVFNCYLLSNRVRWSGNSVEGIGAAWRFRTARRVRVWYQRWPPLQPSWKSSNHNYSRIEGLTELKLDGRHWVL